jgi:TPR repeat protein
MKATPLIFVVVVGCGSTDTYSPNSSYSSQRFHGASPSESNGGGIPRPSRFGAVKNQAKGGDRVAQYQLGQMYWNARGTGRDKNQALVWLKRSAQNGHPAAQHIIGTFYFSGDKVGSPMSLNHSEARRWLQKSSENGYAKSYFMLGSFYMEGIGGPVNLDKAEHWLKKAKAANDPNAARGLQELKGRR